MKRIKIQKKKEMINKRMENRNKRMKKNKTKNKNRITIRRMIKMKRKKTKMKNEKERKNQMKNITIIKIQTIPPLILNPLQDPQVRNYPFNNYNLNCIILHLNHQQQKHIILQLHNSIQFQKDLHKHLLIVSIIRIHLKRT